MNSAAGGITPSTVQYAGASPVAAASDAAVTRNAAPFRSASAVQTATDGIVAFRSTTDRSAAVKLEPLVCAEAGNADSQQIDKHAANCGKHEDGGKTREGP